MSGFDSLLDRLRETYARVAEVELALQESPGDEIGLAKLTSIRRMASRLEDEWEEYSRLRQTEVCRYRMISVSETSYAVSGVSRSILNFQDFFSQIFDAIKNGPKQRARIAGEITTDTSLNFCFTYPGSLGVVFSLPGETTIIGDKYDDTVDALFQVMRIEDDHEVRDLSKALGEAAVKRAFDWSKANYEAGFGVDVNWRTSSGKRKGDSITRDRFGRLVEIISQTSDIEKRKFRVSGILLGLDAKTKRFRFVQPEGDDFSGTVSDVFDLSKRWEINGFYSAEISVEAVTRYATQKTDQTYFLDRLEALSSA